MEKGKAGVVGRKSSVVAVRLIVEREKEIINFKSTSDFKVVIILENSKNELIKAELSKDLKLNQKHMILCKNVCLQNSQLKILKKRQQKNHLLHHLRHLLFSKRHQENLGFRKPNYDSSSKTL